MKPATQAEWMPPGLMPTTLSRAQRLANRVRPPAALDDAYLLHAAALVSQYLDQYLPRPWAPRPAPHLNVGAGTRTWEHRPFAQEPVVGIAWMTASSDAARIFEVAMALARRGMDRSITALRREVVARCAALAAVEEVGYAAYAHWLCDIAGDRGAPVAGPVRRLQGRRHPEPRSAAGMDCWSMAAALLRGVGWETASRLARAGTTSAWCDGVDPPMRSIAEFIVLANRVDTDTMRALGERVAGAAAALREYQTVIDACAALEQTEPISPAVLWASAQALFELGNADGAFATLEMLRMRGCESDDVAAWRCYFDYRIGHGREAAADTAAGLIEGARLAPTPLALCAAVCQAAGLPDSAGHAGQQLEAAVSPPALRVAWERSRLPGGP